MIKGTARFSARRDLDAVHPAAFAALLIAAAFAVAIAVGFANHWRGYRPYQFLAAIGAVGMPVLAVLHNVFYGVLRVSQHPLLTNVFAGLSVAAFIGAVVVCPIALLSALAGAIMQRTRHPA